VLILGWYSYAATVHHVGPILYDRLENCIADVYATNADVYHQPACVTSLAAELGADVRPVCGPVGDAGGCVEFCVHFFDALVDARFPGQEMMCGLRAPWPRNCVKIVADAFDNAAVDEANRLLLAISKHERFGKYLNKDCMLWVGVVHD
jgi:hypothetical protein